MVKLVSILYVACSLHREQNSVTVFCLFPILRVVFIGIYLFKDKCKEPIVQGQATTVYHLQIHVGLLVSVDYLRDW